MPDVAPLRLHISRHYGLSVPPRSPHGGWATCEGRSPGSRLWRLLRPSRHPNAGVSGVVGEDLPLTVAGAAPASTLQFVSHRVPIFIAARERGETLTRLERRKM